MNTETLIERIDNLLEFSPMNSDKPARVKSITGEVKPKGDKFGYQITMVMIEYPSKKQVTKTTNIYGEYSERKDAQKEVDQFVKELKTLHRAG